MRVWGLGMAVYQRRQSRFGGPKGQGENCSKWPNGRNCKWTLPLQENTRRQGKGGSVAGYRGQH